MLHNECIVKLVIYALCLLYAVTAGYQITININYDILPIKQSIGGYDQVDIILVLICPLIISCRVQQ